MFLLKRKGKGVSSAHFVVSFTINIHCMLLVCTRHIPQNARILYNMNGYHGTSISHVYILPVHHIITVIWNIRVFQQSSGKQTGS